MNSALIEADLERDEGYRQFPYTDSVGKLTIGIGFNLTDVGMSKDESLLLVRHRCERLHALLSERISGYDGLTEPRQRALISMAYNLGVGGLLKFHRMLGAMWEHDYEKAAIEALASQWASQVGERAERIAKLIREG